MTLRSEKLWWPYFHDLMKNQREKFATEEDKLVLDEFLKCKGMREFNLLTSQIVLSNQLRSDLCFLLSASRWIARIREPSFKRPVVHSEVWNRYKKY